MKKIILVILALAVSLLLIGCDNLANLGDPFKRDDIEVKAYSYIVHKGDTMDGIIGTFYERNTVFIDWASYRQKHFDINAHLTRNGRAIQPGDEIIVYEVHKKGNKK